MCIQPTNAMDPTQLNRITLFGFLWVDRFRWILIFFFQARVRLGLDRQNFKLKQPDPTHDNNSFFFFDLF